MHHSTTHAFEYQDGLKFRSRMNDDDEENIADYCAYIAYITLYKMEIMELERRWEKRGGAKIILKACWHAFLYPFFVGGKKYRVVVRGMAVE